MTINMNYLQILTFLFFFIIVFITGSGVFALFDVRDKLSRQRFLFLGEILLLGYILIAGELITFSLTKFYFGVNIWVVTVLNMLFLLRKQTRDLIGEFFSRPIKWDPPLIVFLIFLAVLTFRNSFPLMDNDSHSTYMWMPKLWLMHHTSIFGDLTMDVRAFLPHMESVPYALGIVLFGQETLFEGFVNLSWRWIVLFLVFGYTSFRFNRYYALAASLLILLNDHFFYSGINYNVLLNAAVICFVFACAYNFWESREQNSPFRFMLAIIFLSQIIAAKFQMAIVIIFLFFLMVLMQKDLFGKCFSIIKKKNWIIPVIIAIYFAVFWFLKNYLATGLATFPIFAGKFHVWGWTPEYSRVYNIVMGGISFSTFLKYMNYLFIWPGINAAKLVVMIISFTPIIFLIGGLRNSLKESPLTEFSFWFTVSLLVLMGITLGCHQDPRYYRYGIGVMSFTAVYGVWFIFYHCLKIRSDMIIAGLLILISLAPIKLITLHGTSSFHPSIQENVDVFLNKLHTSDLMAKWYERNGWAIKGFNENPEKVKTAAWDVRDPVLTSAFVLPERPHVGLWFNALIRWESYEKEELIIKDLKDNGIEWIMSIKGEGGALRFITIEDYAKEAVHFVRYRKRTYFDYGFPSELSATGL